MIKPKRIEIQQFAYFLNAGDVRSGIEGEIHPEEIPGT